MPIPRTRQELTELVTTSYRQLRAEIETAGPELAELPCADGWTVKEMLAVRTWWTEHVVDWIEVGRRGESPVTPAPGYKWNETPRLNADVVRAARSESYQAVRDRLDRGVQRVLHTIDALDDRELLDVGTYLWAGKWPIIRWISINTARQYTTARAYVRRALRRRERS